MVEEDNKLMLEACFQPTVLPLASKIFSAIHDYSKTSSELIGGMGFSFKSLDKEKMVRLARQFRNIDLTRYEYFIDMYENGLSKLYSKKDNSNG